MGTIPAPVIVEDWMSTNNGYIHIHVHTHTHMIAIAVLCGSNQLCQLIFATTPHYMYIGSDESTARLQRMPSFLVPFALVELKVGLTKKLPPKLSAALCWPCPFPPDFFPSERKLSCGY